VNLNSDGLNFVVNILSTTNVCELEFGTEFKYKYFVKYKS